MSNTRPRMLSTALDHQKGTARWVHDAVPRSYAYNPLTGAVSGSSGSSGIRGLPTVAMINSARVTAVLGGEPVISAGAGDGDKGRPLGSV
eukprot:CAMPEP_0198685526 /NCGR_PEP_ID=MMETSP1468-20131203/13765_1 /TAXON_ID=1461545 /ORGANISM="Mantoniella sp, Strain CCMP1436" /LENGTH=89 /DNA_ID=CAMNT_0044431069 /DNA_START=474 /DNA_END=739 /DNA_ORIENTATION=+